MPMTAEGAIPGAGSEPCQALQTSRSGQHAEQASPPNDRLASRLPIPAAPFSDAT